MQKKILCLLTACAFILAAIPAATASSGGPVVPTGPPCPGFAIYTPATSMPLYVTAMHETNMLLIQLQEFLAGVEDPSIYDMDIAAINEQLAMAAQGSNYVHKKDMTLVAKGMIEQLLAA